MVRSRLAHFAGEGVLRQSCVVCVCVGVRRGPHPPSWYVLLWRCAAVAALVAQAVTLHTTLGDIKLELACAEAPKTCEVRHGMPWHGTARQSTPRCATPVCRLPPCHHHPH